MQRALIIDIETESDSDLHEVTAHVYASHPSTRVERVGWSFDGARRTWTPATTAGVPPADLVRATDEADSICAYNAEFDFTVIDKALPAWKIPPHKVQCLMHRTMAAGIRRKADSDSAIGLDDAAVLAGAPEDLRKFPQELIDATGYSWVKAGTLLSTPEEREAARDAYVLQDVRVAEWLAASLPPLTEFEIRCFQSCRRMNAAGMPVDRKLLERVHEIGKRVSERAETRFAKATGLRPTQREKAQAWFVSAGVQFDDMRRETLIAMIDAGEVPDDLLQAVEDYIDVSTKPFQRYAEMLRLTEADGRLRGTLMHAVAHTGRDSGRYVNLQNAKRPSLDRDGQTALAEMVLNGAGIDEIESFFGSASLAMADLQRAVFKAPEGKLFADGDFAKAEPMTGYWLTGEKDSDKPYHDVGVRIANGMIAGKPESEWRKMPIIANLNLPAGVTEVRGDHISKSSLLYTVSKSAHLGSGYGQQSAGLLATLAAKGITIPREVADAATKACRLAKPKTFRLADDVMSAFAAACAGRRTELAEGKIVVQPYAYGVEILLPSGRSIRYRKMKVHHSVGAYGKRRITVTYVPGYAETASGKRLVTSIHAGTILENIMSSIARDFLYESINRACAAGLEVVLGVHDQVLAVVGTERERKTLEEIMNAPAPWSRGFAMSAEVELHERFGK